MLIIKREYNLLKIIIIRVLMLLPLTVSLSVGLVVSGCGIKKAPLNLKPQIVPEDAVVDGVLSVPKVDPLSPGARPIVISVSTDPSKHVARTAVTWSYHCGNEPSKQGGVAVFDATGGATVGQIDKDCNDPIVDMKVSVDYASPLVLDLSYNLSLPVSTAGVNQIFSITAHRISTLFYFDIRRRIKKKDYALLSWQYKSDVAPAFTAAGTIDLSLQDLITAKSYVIAKQFSIPIRNNTEGNVTYTLTGVIGGKSILWEKECPPSTPSIYLQIKQDASIQTSLVK